MQVLPTGSRAVGRASRSCLLLRRLTGGQVGRSASHLRRPAPVHGYLPHLIELIWNRTINPGRVFHLHLPLDQAAEAYRAMDQPRAIKVLLQP